MDGSPSEEVRSNLLGLGDMHMPERKEGLQGMATLVDGIDSPPVASQSRGKARKEGMTFSSPEGLTNWSSERMEEGHPASHKRGALLGVRL